MLQGGVISDVTLTSATVTDSRTPLPAAKGAAQMRHGTRRRGSTTASGGAGLPARSQNRRQLTLGQASIFFQTVLTIFSCTQKTAKSARLQLYDLMVRGLGIREATGLRKPHAPQSQEAPSSGGSDSSRSSLWPRRAPNAR